MKSLKVKFTLTEEMLGTASANPDVHREYIASKAPDARSMEEEVAAVGVDGVAEKQMTVFHRHDGKPCMVDYQLKGYFKDACAALARVPGTKSSKLKAYKKTIDGCIFVFPRMIPLEMPNGAQVGNCQRPLRAQTAQGERVALANSETVPAGTVITCEVRILDDGLEGIVTEWLEYGELRGFGQWRNSGKGRFKFEIL